MNLPVERNNVTGIREAILTGRCQQDTIWSFEVIKGLCDEVEMLRAELAKAIRVAKEARETERAIASEFGEVERKWRRITSAFKDINAVLGDDE